ncbi:TAXI family TRAP transporter solute-binding subunit [Chloroflexota bacterium]
MVSSKEQELIFQSENVSSWGMFFARIASFLSFELPSLPKTTIILTNEMFSTAEAVSEGKADMGIVTPPACIAMAYRGVGPYAKKMNNLRAIGSFPHNDRMLWAVPADSGIKSIEDMKDNPLRLVLPSNQFPVRFLVEKILLAYGTSLEELIGRGWQIIEENHCLKIPLPVVRGEADAVVHEALPTPAWRELSQKRNMRFLPIRTDVLQMLEDNYGFRRAVLSKGVLRGIDEDTPCVDFCEWTMFVREDMPDDLAYRIVRIFVEQKETFESMGRGIQSIDPREVWRNVGEVPLHPAAKRYYQENGYM